MRGQGLYRLYRTGGEKFLAMRLSLLFKELQTPEDVALHNDVVTDVLQIINTAYSPDPLQATEEESILYEFIAGILLRKRVKRRRFLLRVAYQILHIGQKKG
jgi:hypothetical protein